MNPGKMDKWLTVTVYDATAGVYKKVRNAYGAYQYKSRVVLSPHSAALPDFVAVLSEKYIAHDQQAANAELRAEQVLITAKAVDLRSGDDVTVDGIAYTVMTAHTADDWLNEYIVLRVEDA